MPEYDRPVTALHGKLSPVVSDHGCNQGRTPALNSAIICSVIVLYKSRISQLRKSAAWTYSRKKRWRRFNERRRRQFSELREFLSVGRVQPGEHEAFPGPILRQIAGNLRLFVCRRLGDEHLGDGLGAGAVHQVRERLHARE